MKRKDFVKYLLENGCKMIREGARHSVFLNSSTNNTSTVPRHNEIDNNLTKKFVRI